MPETPIEISETDSESPSSPSSTTLSTSPSSSPTSTELKTGFFPHPTPKLPEPFVPLSNFKKNSNVFVFNGPLYFSISGGSFELKTGKSKRPSSALIHNLSPLAEKVPAADPDDLLPTRVLSDPEPARGLSDPEAVDPDVAGVVAGAQSHHRHLEADLPLNETNFSSLSDLQNVTEPSSLLEGADQMVDEGDPNPQPLRDPRVDLAEFFQERYLFLERSLVE